MAGKHQVGGSRKQTPRRSEDDCTHADAERMQAAVGKMAAEATLWEAFMRAHRTIVGKMTEQMMRDHNLPLEWFDVLIHLAYVPEGRLRQRALLDRLLLSESGVSRLLLRMEQAGLITRCTAGEDRRGIVITMTAQGRSAVTEATESHISWVSSLFNQRLTQTDRNALTRVLPKLAADADSDFP